MQTRVYYYGALWTFQNGVCPGVWHGFDQWEMEAAAKVFRRGDHILNAGNGLGGVSALLSGMFGARSPDGHWSIVPYEANEALVHLAARNVLVDDVLMPVYWGAIGTEKRGALFGVQEKHWWESSLAYQPHTRAALVPMHDINDLVREHGINAILLDIEGGEVDVIPHLDFGPIDALVLEIHRDPFALMEEIERAGLTIVHRKFLLGEQWVVGATRRA